MHCGQISGVFKRHFDDISDPAAIESPEAKKQLCDLDYDLCVDQESVEELRYQYDTETEPKPSVPFYEPKVQAALRKGVILAERAFETVESICQLDESTIMNDLKEEISNLRNYQCAAKKIVALLGGSGEGKCLHI
jgi:hypothetical protein